MTMAVCSEGISYWKLLNADRLKGSDQGRFIRTMSASTNTRVVFHEFRMGSYDILSIVGTVVDTHRILHHINTHLETDLSSDPLIPVEQPIANIQEQKETYYTMDTRDVPKLMGLHGRTVKRIKRKSGASIELFTNLPPQFEPVDGTVCLFLRGTDLAIACAVSLINEQLLSNIPAQQRANNLDLDSSMSSTCDSENYDGDYSSHE